MDKEIFKLYEDGKHRRYNQLFVLNGGAFAVAKILFTDKGVTSIGGLTIDKLSIGMILLTVVMVYDIFRFGLNMRKADTETTDKREIIHRSKSTLFGWPGRIVLVAIGLIICTGWYFAGLRS